MNKDDEEVQQLKAKVTQLERKVKIVWQLYKDSQAVVEQYERMLQNQQETNKLLLFSQSSSCSQPNVDPPIRSPFSSPVNSTASQYDVAAAAVVPALPPSMACYSMDLLAPVRGEDVLHQTPSSQHDGSNNGEMKISPIAFPIKIPAPIDFDGEAMADSEDELGFAVLPPPPVAKREVKFQEAVRGKEARQALPGHSCKECELFYETIKDALHPGEDVQTVMNRYSRHRHRHKPPSTPPGYWDVWSLPPEDETEDQQRQVKRRKI